MIHKIRSGLLIALILSIVSYFIGCSPVNIHTMTDKEAYTNAIENLYDEDFAVKVTAVQAIRNGSQQLTQTTIKNIFYNDYASSKMRTSLQATTALNESNFSYNETCADGISILDINSSSFTAELTEEQMLLRYANQCPLLSPDLYKQLVHQYTDGRRVIGFSQPIQAESWALPEDAEFIDASGRAVLLSDGSLYESTYSVMYSCGQVTVAQTVTARFDPQCKSKITLPAETQNPIPLADLDAPILLETACARLLSSYAVSSQSKYDITCEAGGLQRIQTTQTRLTGLRPNLDAQVDTTVELINLSQQGTVRSHTQKEVFSDGTYSIDSDNASTQQTDHITEDVMQTYCRNNLVSSIMLPQYISGIEITRSPQGYLLSFTASEDLSRLLFSNAYQSLYNDFAAEDAINSYVTQSITGHIEIERNTFLPISSGMAYEGTNTIDQSTYAFRVAVDQIYLYD